MKNLFALLLYLPSILFAISLPENHSVNGGLTIIPIEASSQPEATFEGKKIPVLQGYKPNQWLLIVAIPLNNKEPIQHIQLEKPTQNKIPFQISDKVYLTQYLSIKDVNKVDPLPQDMERIQQETKKLADIYARFTPTNPFIKPFSPPLKGPISSLFGLNRFYNKEPRDPHSGLDIAADQGIPVLATSDGIVAETGDYFFTGNTVIIDHGMGVFSLYAHLSKIDVKIGEPIKQGQTLGLVGMTGRVTGPHLHWTMVVNQTVVDPLLFVPVRKIAIALPPPPKKTDKEKQATENKSSQSRHPEPFGVAPGKLREGSRG